MHFLGTSSLVGYVEYGGPLLASTSSYVLVLRYVLVARVATTESSYVLVAVVRTSSYQYVVCVGLPTT